MKKILLLSAMCLMSIALSAQKFVDLGLPSGTHWKTTNELGFYTYDDAVSKFGKNLPTKAQFDELKEYCEWIWVGRGFKVVGPNGSFIFLPASGFRNCEDGEEEVGKCGYYWSSTPTNSFDAWNITFKSDAVNIYDDERCNGQSVRLVQD